LNDPTNSVKALKEVAGLRIRLQSHQVHLIMLQYYNMQYTDINKIHTYTKMNLSSKHSKMGAVKQNPIQRTVRSAHMCVHCTVHSYCTRYCTEQSS